MKWLAIYQKFLPESERDPMAFEAHGWEVEADSPDQALEILEQRADIPWRTFFVEVKYTQLAPNRFDVIRWD